MPMPRKPTPEKSCEQCGTPLERKRLRNGRLESLLHFSRRKFCNRICFAQNLDARPSKSDSWSMTHYHARKIIPPGPCQRCGKPSARDVHHKDGNHQNNSSENLERICRSCHNMEHKTPGSCVLCGNPQKGLGYCNKHYLRFKKYGDPQASRIPPRKTCKVCGEPANARKMCGRHYMQAKRKGELG